MKTILIGLCGVVMGTALSACSDLPHIRALHDPLTPEEHVTLGLTYEVQGHRDLAAREYRTALTQEAGYVPALIGLGNVAFAEGALEESETYYQQALAASPEHPGANNSMRDKGGTRKPWPRWKKPRQRLQLRTRFFTNA